MGRPERYVKDQLSKNLRGKGIRARGFVFTVGYSGKKFEGLARVLTENKIQVLVDVRRFPSSKYPEFTLESLTKELHKLGIEYVHIEGLGGFRGGYKSYMGQESFKAAFEVLLRVVRTRQSCLMCREALSKYCHRRFIARKLLELGFKIIDV